jgi:hypothetical protein
MARGTVLRWPIEARQKGKKPSLRGGGRYLVRGSLATAAEVGREIEGVGRQGRVPSLSQIDGVSGVSAGERRSWG